MATIGSVIQYVDDVKPNAFGMATKIEWLNEVEGLVQTEVLLRAIEEIQTYSWPTDTEAQEAVLATELLVRPPHDKLYRAYLTAMVDYANGEYSRYQDTVVMFNAHFGEYQRWFAHTYRPADTHGEVYADAGTLIDTEWRGYYITAYGIAVKHGYKGTEAEWVQDVYGGAASAAASATAAAASATAAAASETAAAASETAAAASEAAAAASEAAAEDYAEHIADPVGGLVTEWLEDNIVQETGYVIDESLTVSEAAADAKRTGDVKRSGLDRTNTLNGLVDYGYTDEDVDAGTSGALKVAVSRRNTEVTLTLASSLSNDAYIKLSGSIDRRGSTSTVDQNWTTGIQLVPGRRYRAIMKRLSGTVTGSAPEVRVYTVGAHSAYGSRTATGADLSIREFTAPSDEVNLLVFIPSGTTLASARYQVLLQDCAYDDAGNIGKLYEKRTLIDGLPFYEIRAPFVTSGYRYKKVDGAWVKDDSEAKPSTAVIPCPKYLMIYPKAEGNPEHYIYIGTVNNTRPFVPDETIELVVTPGGFINYVRDDYLFKTLETDGTKYMVILGRNATETGYEDNLMIIGADEWPVSPLTPSSWSWYTGAADNTISASSTTKQGFYLPEESWVFIKDVDYALINYGRDTRSGADYKDYEWTKARENVSAMYIPKDSGMPMLTVNATDTVTEENVCIVPKKILDKCVSSNGTRAKKLADDILTKFKWTGRAATANISSNAAITVGKEYHTIPYTNRWNGQHWVCFETSPETAANAANDPYSVFYDNTGYDPDHPNANQFMRSELDKNGLSEPGYGGVCSIWVGLASGAPYPQSVDGYFADPNFEVAMMANPRSGDAIMRIEENSDHGCMVDAVLDNGYSVYEWKPPGIIQSIHTSGLSTKHASHMVSRDYLKRYNYVVASRDRSGWDKNYLDFDYTVANGSIRPWRGNKSVCSNYNKITEFSTSATYPVGAYVRYDGKLWECTTAVETAGAWDSAKWTLYANAATSVSLHTGIHITVHDSATTAYIKKPGGTVVTVDVTGQTVVTINDICDEAGTYELWSDVSETKEYFRYFIHDAVTVRLDDDWTCVFEYEDGTPADDVEYAHVNTMSVETPYPEIGRATVTILYAGKKYPGIRLRQYRASETYGDGAGVKCAVVRDPTTKVVNEATVDDSWGRYPIACTTGYTKWVQPESVAFSYGQNSKVAHNGKRWVSDTINNTSEPGVANWTEVSE